jgi:hypothetical protein
MSKVKEAPQGGDVAVSIEEQTSIHQGVVVQGDLIINQAPPPAKKTAILPHAKASKRVSPHESGLIKPIVSFAEDGDRITTYPGKDGATATFREDRQNNEAVTLTLKDATGTLTTFGNHRGYEAVHTNRNGGVTKEKTVQDSKLGKFFELGGVVDRVECPGLQRDVNISPSVTDQVTRDKLQDFADKHPDLRDTLKTVGLPVTVTGGLQINFAEALKLPSSFESCPVGKREAIVTKVPAL